MVDLQKWDPLIVSIHARMNKVPAHAPESTARLIDEIYPVSVKHME